MRPRLYFSRSDAVIDTDPQADALAARAFAKDDAIAFEDVFAGDARAMLEQACAAAVFVPQEIDGLGPRLYEKPFRTALALHVLLRRPVLLDWIAKITGCGPLSEVKGTTARFTAGTEQRLDWHDDMNGEPRRLGVTIGLGHEAYDGGLFEMKRGDAAPHFHFVHARPFTMLVFRVGKTLEHRVTPVTAGGPRTVFGGWFLGPS